MFDYTGAAFKKIKTDFERLLYAFQVLSQLVYIGYLIYALIVAKDYLWANIILLTLSVAYFVFFLFATKGKLKTDKTAKTIVDRIYKHCKRLVKLLTMGLTVYAFCLTANHVTPISLLFIAFMIVGWVLDLVFYIILRIFIDRFELIAAGLQADFEPVTKPVTTVGNFFKRLTGKEVSPERKPTKKRLFLDKKVAQAREEKRKEKQRVKEEKQALRLQQAQERQRLKDEQKQQIGTKK